MAGGTLVIRFIGDLKQFEATTAKVGKRVQSAGRGLTKGLTLPIVAGGVAALKMSGDFEKGMNRVKAVSGATGGQFTAMREQAKELGATTQFSATQAADAMGFLAMAGFKANDIIGAMPSTLNLAAAGQLDLGRAADITSNIMTGYGMTVDELAGANDVLVKTFTSTNTDLEQLGEAFKYAGPVAKSAGVDFEEAAAAIGMMGNAGIQGSMAGTSLRGAITRLLSPTGTASKAIEKLGLNVTDSEGKLLPLNKIVEQLGKSGATTGDMMTIFGQRAGPAMAALVDQGAGSMRKLTKQLENSGGTAEDVAKTQMEGLQGGLVALKSAAEGFAIAIGDSGLLDKAAAAVEKLTGKVRDATKWFEDLSPSTQGWIMKILAVLAALGPTVWIIGKLISAASTLAKVIQALTKVKVIWAAVTKLAGKAALGTRIHLAALAVQTAVVSAAQKVAAGATVLWAGAMKVLNMVMRMNPIGLVITGLVLLVAGLIAAYKKSETFRKIVDKAFSAIKRVAGAVVGWIGDKVIPFFTEKIPAAFGAVVDWVRKHWKKLLPGISIPLTLARIFVDKVWGRIRGFFEAAWRWVSTSFKRSWSLIRGILTDPLGTARALIDRVWDRIRGLFSAAWDWVRGTFDRLWNGLENIVTSPIEAARRVLGRLLGSGGAIRSLFSGAVDAITRIWDGLREAAAAPVRFVVNTVYQDGIRAAVNKIPGVPDLPSLHFARGGPVPEWLGKKGRDSVAAWLMPGEHVWTAKEVREAGGHGAIEAMRRGVLEEGALHRQMNAPGFASGGPIPAAGIWSQHTSGYPWARWAGDINIPGSGDYGNPVRAYQDGYVSAVMRMSTSYGNHVRMNHPGTNEHTLYAHLSRIIVNVGQQLARGQVLGAVGSTGNSSGPHLHFEVMGGQGPIARGSGGGSVVSKFSGAVEALKDLLGKVKGWWSELRSMGGWGGMMVDMGQHLVSKVRDYFADKIPGLGKLMKLFDSGGILRSGQLAANLSGRPERVLDPATTAAFERLVRVLNDQATRQALITLTRAGDLSKVGSRRGPVFGPGGPGGPGAGGPMQIRGRLELRDGEAYIAGIAEYVVNDVLDLADTSGRMG